MKTMIANGPRPVDPTVCVRHDDGSEHELDARYVTERALVSAQPWRTFRSYFGQTHYSGRYWAATQGDHVIYESLLEKSRLREADFDPDVKHIVAQPFLLRAQLDGKVRRHIPDYLLFTSSGLTVVNVKPRSRLDDPRVVRTFGWARKVIEDRGWGFEVATEPDPVRLSNVRFLAGYRREEGISPLMLDELRVRNLDGHTVGYAINDVGGDAARARAALLHLIWRHEFTVDLSRRLSAKTILRRM